MKKLLMLVFILTSFAVFSKNIKVIAPTGAPELTLIKQMKDNKLADVNYEIFDSPDVLSSKIISGEADIAIIPSNLAANLYNKGIDYKFVGTSVWGVLYMVSSDNKIKTWKDLKGKEISTIGRGLTPDAILKYLLKSNGLDSNKDVKINYVNSTPELAQLFLANKIETALISEPVLTNVLGKKKDGKIIFDIQKEWKKVTKLSIPQAVIVVKSSLIKENKKFVDNFISEYEKGIKWLISNPSEAGAYIETKGKGLTKEIIKNSIPRSNLKFKSAIDSKKEMEEYYKVLLDFEGKLVGGKLPNEDFYYKK